MPDITRVRSGRRRWGRRRRSSADVAPTPGSETEAPDQPQAGTTSSAAGLLCRAPWAALYLDPRGEVKVCCQNEWHRLGNVATSSLVDIWRGPELQRLRDRVAVGDLGLGCEMCATSVERGAPELAYFNSFEHLDVDLDRLEWPLQLDLALSNTCNLRCVMCNGELSSSIRSQVEHRPPLESPYGEAFFEELDEFLPHLRTVSFLGGEPFLARESVTAMERMVELGLTPVCHVTTNGTVLTPRIERIVTSLPMELTVSIDAATPGVLEAVRRGVDHAELFANLRRFRELVGTEHLRLAFCLMLPTWREMGDVLRLGDELDVDVLVNTVHHPPHLSFAHCPLDVLDEAIAGLREEDARRRAELTRNRAVWTAQVDGLAALRRQRGERHGGHTTHVELAPRRGASARPAVLHADRRQLVDEITVGAAAEYGLDLDVLRDQSLWQVVHLLTSSLGRLERSEARRTAAGEERLFDFDGPRGEVRVVATMTADPTGGSTWELEFSDRGAGS